MDSAEKQARYRARKQAADAGTNRKAFPGLPVDHPDYFTSEQFELRKAFAEAVWAEHGARPESDLRPVKPDAKQNKPKVNSPRG